MNVTAIRHVAIKDLGQLEPLLCGVRRTIS